MNEDSIALTALDQMVTNDRTQMLKALIPYLPLQFQEILSVYAKSRELSNTLSLFSPAQRGGQMRAASLSQPSPGELLKDVRSCCGGELRQKADEIANLITMVQMMQTMQEASAEEGEEKGECL